MSSQPAPVRVARREGEEVVRKPPFEWLARAGLVARGVIYAIIAILAVKVALNAGGRTTDRCRGLRLPILYAVAIRPRCHPSRRRPRPNPRLRRGRTTTPPRCPHRPAGTPRALRLRRPCLLYVLHWISFGGKRKRRSVTDSRGILKQRQRRLMVLVK